MAMQYSYIALPPSALRRYSCEPHCTEGTAVLQLHCTALSDCDTAVNRTALRVPAVKPLRVGYR